jgi:hypothetical protein
MSHCGDRAARTSPQRRCSLHGGRGTFARALACCLAPPAAAAAAAVHGYTTAFGWSVGIFAVGAIAALALFTRGVPQVSPAAEPAPALH